jgi:hypothetical protein
MERRTAALLIIYGLPSAWQFFRQLRLILDAWEVYGRH